ncbi:hypothetical protein NTJ56_24635 [Burkholderia contaminans]|uniref:hypothetical protein n=1 Tax=Burkholderia contaminans TaxID=488447 RepID=UPI001CF465BF|nr:hypothetical protein [Burkholderia contaminans]MCA7914300.1 hypothetical protein [Burkholderia contaminans]UUX41601.1 hypothetical protein NTJ56_24635 [Burkholderia contaminans]
MKKNYILFIFIAVQIALLAGCVGWNQKANEALIREPGHRVYNQEVKASEMAAKQWEFALLSEVAYIKVGQIQQYRKLNLTLSADALTDEKAVSSLPAPCPIASSVLKDAGWVHWQDFPSPELKSLLTHKNLRVEAWARQSPPAVAVTFGGTVFDNPSDWESNLRWFIPWHNDEYTVLVTKVAPDFIDTFKRHVANADEAWLAQATLYSTGHSLGGGLAQEFAYALPQDVAVQRVAQVYAFDPSPVTGYYSVDSATRDVNRKNLSINRIFERGEVLAAIRSITALVYPPSTASPAVMTVRYNFDGLVGPISAHSMDSLACGLYLTSH